LSKLLPKELTPQALGLFILRWAGLDFQKPGEGGSLEDEIKKRLDVLSGGKLTQVLDLLDAYNQKLTGDGERITLENLGNTFLKRAVQAFKDNLAELVANVVVTFVASGGLLGLWELLKFFLGPGLTHVKEILKHLTDAARATNPVAVARAVVKGLGKAVVALLALIAKVTKLDVVICKIREALLALRRWVQEQLRKLVEWLRRKLGFKPATPGAAPGKACPTPLPMKGQAPGQPGPKPAPPKCFDARAAAWDRDREKKPLRDGDRCGDPLPRVDELSESERHRVSCSWETRGEHLWSHPQRLWFFADQGGGDNVRGWLLREAEEFTLWGVRVGGRVKLDLPEQGVCGWVWVQALEDRPKIPEGPGRLVTGWFRHERAIVGDLWIEGEPESLGVTAGHPVFSADRNRWVAAGELRIGERLLAADGSMPRVLCYRLRPEAEPVYNIEVEGDHCYRVGEQGLLVHNASAVCDPCDDLKTNTFEIDHVTKTVSDHAWDTVEEWKRQGYKCKTSRGTERKVRVVKSARWLFVKTTPPDGTDTTELARMWCRCTVGINRPAKDAAGHTIAFKMGGSGAGPGQVDDKLFNIFPQNASLNSGVFKEHEKAVRMAALKNRVCAVIVLVYSDPDLPGRPSRIEYDVWINGAKNPSGFGLKDRSYENE
jgi:hypothetical protein